MAADGPVTIVVVSPLISRLELAWEEPARISGAGSRRVPGWCCPVGGGGMAGSSGGRGMEVCALSAASLALAPVPHLNRRAGDSPLAS